MMFVTSFTINVIGMFWTLILKRNSPHNVINTRHVHPVRDTKEYIFDIFISFSFWKTLLVCLDLYHVSDLQNFLKALQPPTTPARKEQAEKHRLMMGFVAQSRTSPSPQAASLHPSSPPWRNIMMYNGTIYYDIYSDQGKPNFKACNS